MIVNGFLAADLRVQAAPAAAGTFENLFVADPDGPPMDVLAIVVCNTSASAITFQLCHDLDAAGTPSYGKDNALYWDKSVPANDTFVAWQSNHPGGGLSVGKTGAIGISASTEDTLTFTAYLMTSATQERSVEGER